MTLKLEFETDNAAFDGYRADEVSRILREIAERVEAGIEADDIRDINGNKIGQYAMIEEGA